LGYFLYNPLTFIFLGFNAKAQGREEEQGNHFFVIRVTNEQAHSTEGGVQSRLTTDWH
jgi:hypothetical protein